MKRSIREYQVRAQSRLINFCISAGRNRHADVENRLVDTGGKGGWDELRQYHWLRYTAMCKTESYSGKQFCLAHGTQLRGSVMT